MIISSSAFRNGDYLPEKYIRDGDNINPPLEIVNVPGFAKSLFVTLREESEVGRGKVHWVVWNINPKIEKIEEGVMPQGAVVGRNSFGTNNYIGPSVEDNVDSFIFRAYALDGLLKLPEDTALIDIVKEMDQNIVASAKLTCFLNNS